MLRLDFWKGLLKRKVLSRDLKSEREGSFRKLAGSEFQADEAMKLKEHEPTDFRLHLGIFNIFSLEDRRVRDV